MPNHQIQRTGVQQWFSNNIYLALGLYAAADLNRSAIKSEFDMTTWLTAIFGFLTTITAAYFSAKWATRKAFQERWWERKEKAYSELIEALHDIIRYSDMCAEEYLTHREQGHPKKKEFGEKYSEAYWKIQRTRDIGAFVISEKAASVLDELQKRPKLKWDENPPWEIYEEDSEHFRNALKQIRIIARKDLKI